MKQGIILGILSLLIYTNVFAQTFKDSCFFANSKNGLNVRLKPNIESNPFHVLQFGDVVELAPKAKLKEDDWVKIRFNGDQVGYVMSTYLSKNLKELPERSLYLFYIYNSKEQEFEGQENPKYNWFDNRMCYPYYEDSWHNPSAYRQDGERDESNKDLRSRISIELIDIGSYASRKLENPFELSKEFKVNSRMDTSNIPYFYLPVENNGDSVLFKDYPGEGYIGKSYMGEIKKLNSYVISEFYEEPTFYVMDKRTGEIKFLSPGYPNISPEGEYVISIHESYSYNDDYSSVFYLGQAKNLNAQYNSSMICSVYFKSWLPADQGESSFWISDKEILIKVFPVDNIIYNDGGEKHYQWLKVTILE